MQRCTVLRFGVSQLLRPSPSISRNPPSPSSASRRPSYILASDQLLAELVDQHIGMWCCLPGGSSLVSYRDSLEFLRGDQVFRVEVFC